MADPKRELRERIAGTIAGLDDCQRASASLTACRLLAHMREFTEAERVLAFASMPDEIDVTELLRAAL